MPFRRIAVGIDEMRVFHAELRRQPVHLFRESFDAARAKHRRCVRRVVSGPYHHPVEQVLHGHGFPGINRNKRAVFRHVCRGVGNHHGFIQIAQGQRGQQRHDLRGAGGFRLFIRRLFKQDFACDRVDQAGVSGKQIRFRQVFGMRIVKVNRRLDSVYAQIAHQQGVFLCGQPSVLTNLRTPAGHHFLESLYGNFRIGSKLSVHTVPQQIQIGQLSLDFPHA